MKHLILILVMFTSFFSCKSDDDNEPIGNEIYGSWILKETKISDGSNPTEWTEATNSYTIIFNKDNTFSRNDFASCGSGTYVISQDPANSEYKIITLTYSCNNNDFEHQFKNKYRIISITSIELITNNINCIEECSEKYKRNE
ncbi:hypothetical protein [Chryseobacterium sp. SC28]|uniref:hypothetical protein n=1 Tax=Chryseobacterium sp. SC28 TaxID=2268028 RepID=UPI000F647506|nr:hypothetical protein [Chryseobacterium sp. SC28]RRQ46875.1 hypothetical protein DTW91_03465 [Chryseobacterium sp. SC28]